MPNPWKTVLDRVQGKAPKGAKRSPLWRSVRRNFMLHKTCAVCRKGTGLEAHHVVPFWLGGRELELDPDNLIALCRRHHYAWGHLENWKSINPTVRADCAYYGTRVRNAKEIVR